MSSAGQKTKKSAFAQRPQQNFVTGALTLWLRRLSFGLSLITGAVLLISYPGLPSQIPIHFNLVGQADGWGSKNTVFILITIFTVMCVALTLLSSRPRLFNYPFPITETNAQACYREGERMMVHLLSFTTVLYCAIAAGTIWGVVSGPAIMVALFGIIVTSAVGIVRLFRIER